MKIYSFNISNDESYIWDIKECIDTFELVNLLYYKVEDLSSRGFTYNRLLNDPYIEILEDIQLPLDTTPNSILLDYNFKTSSMDYNYYKGLLQNFLRNRNLDQLLS